MKRGQAGVSLFMVAIVLILIVGGFLAAMGLLRTNRTAGGSAATLGSLVAGQVALEQYAGSTGRLPCPANPALDTGDAVPDAAVVACTFPTGTIPWRTIGLRREDAYDPWGGKISYRVYTAATGALTQNNGASMVQCDSVVPAGNPTPGVNANGLCYEAFDRHTKEQDFLAGKGFTVSDFGTNVTQVGYVLISHGPTGLGSWTSGGMLRAAPANAGELANTTATGPFMAQAASAPGTDPTMAPHFDDLLAYRTISEIAKHASLGARDWPDPALATENVTLNTATVTDALDAPATYGDLGRPTLQLGNSSITAFDSGGNQNLAFDTAGGNEGIGGAASGNGLSETGGEGVRIQLVVKARKLGVTLNDFGYIPAGFPFWRERVEFRFIDSATSAQVNVTRQGCRADGGLASFAAIDAGMDFDTIEIRPLVSTSDPFFGTSISSTFFLSAFRTCTAGAATCSSALETAGNLCP